MSNITFADLAELTTRPGHEVLPITDEQQQIVAAELTPAIVTAGAGSGKTHTMMLRILWLIANYELPPSAVLGLTFTKKAAGELRERILRGIHRLRQEGLVVANEFDEPRISTYNSFASNIYQQYALLIGREPDAVLLDEPNAFALMRQVVLDSNELGLAELEDYSLPRLVRDCLNLTRMMRENEVTTDMLIDHVEAFLARMRELGGEDYSGFNSKTLIANELHLERWERLPILARVGRAYQQRKQELGYLEFADQVASASEIIRLDTAIANEVRADTVQVILDEYQDTSVGQTRLFAGLFRDRGVMAVGDPKQSIYAWRGASATNMRRFPTDFSSTSLVQEFTLTTSWRNDRTILDTANLLAQPLPAPQRGQPLRAGETAGLGEVRVHHYLTETQETDEIAAWFQAHLQQTPEATGAILVRARASMDTFAQALARRDVPYQIIGLGGLLHTPEIVDLVALLRAAADEYAGNEVLRLLLGSRFELGIADVHAISRLAVRLARASSVHEELSQDAQAELDADLRGALAGASLTEALEWLRTASDTARATLCADLSKTGCARAVAAATLLHRLRGHLNLPLVDWVSIAVRLSRLDIETVANPRTVAQTANLDLFVSAVADYARAMPNASIDEFLDWLDHSFNDDQLAAHAPVPPKEGVVQLTTIHSAKGLEWDYVAVGTLAQGKLPDTKGSKVLLEAGSLPNALRQDRDDLPQLRLEKVHTVAELKHQFTCNLKYDLEVTGDDAKRPFAEQSFLQQLREDRRLIYVAATRAKHGLMLTGSRWRPERGRPLLPSTFLLERRNPLPLEYRDGEEPWATIDGEPVVFLAETVECDGKEINRQLQENPLAGAAELAAWPAAPMSSTKLEHLRGLAVEVSSRAAAETTASRYDTLIDLLLAEQREQELPAPLALPRRFGASALHDLLADPVAAARNAARPMPQRPFRATVLGNVFHAWVENLYGDVAGSGSRLEMSDGSDSDFAESGSVQLSKRDEQRLEQMQATFLASRFARNGRKPVAVELPIQTPLGEYIVKNKLDAVYRDEDGTVEIVDWKTGRAPTTDQEHADRELQLRSYGHAYAESYGVPVHELRATLYYVASDEEISLTDLGTREQLLELLHAAQRSVEEHNRLG